MEAEHATLDFVGMRSMRVAWQIAYELGELGLPLQFKVVVDTPVSQGE